MKLSISKSNLLKGVQIVSKAVSNKTTMSILECILIDARDGQIRLVANDMDLGIETFVEGEIIESGIVAIECKVFSEIVRKLPDSNIFIDVYDDFKVNIECENSKFSILGRNWEEFNDLPNIDKTDGIIISEFALKEIIHQTIFSISDNDTNKIMGGELFEINNDTLRVISLDGHRISIRKITLKNDYGFKKCIVPGKSLNDLSKNLSGSADQDVTIYMADKFIIFEFNTTTMVSRLIEGEYFKIDQMLSTDYETKFKINKKEFLDCIDRATLLVKEGDKKPVIITIGDEMMELKIDSVVGSMKENLSITKEGKDIMIGFNPKFLMDALRVIDEEEVTLYMVNPKAPCFIRDDAQSYTYLILPVNFTVVK